MTDAGTPTVTVTITGPAGTGKSIIARQIAHLLSVQAGAAVTLVDDGESQARKYWLLPAIGPDEARVAARADWVVRTSNVAADAEVVRLRADLAEAVDALDIAKLGLVWYRDMHPEHVDGSDDEADEKIDAVLAKHGRA